MTEPSSPDIEGLLTRAETYIKINAPDGRGSALLVMELADALRARSSAGIEGLRHRIATMTIDDEGHRNSELQQVLVAGYVALKWALPLQAADETISAIVGILNVAPAGSVDALINAIDSPTVAALADVFNPRNTQSSLSKSYSQQIVDILLPRLRSVAQPSAVREALELAEDVLSRAPFSTDIWPNGMHPNTGIKKIRAALAISSTPQQGE